MKNSLKNPNNYWYSSCTNNVTFTYNYVGY